MPGAASSVVQPPQALSSRQGRSASSAPLSATDASAGPAPLSVMDASTGSAPEPEPPSVQANVMVRASKKADQAGWPEDSITMTLWGIGVAGVGMRRAFGARRSRLQLGYDRGREARQINQPPTHGCEWSGEHTAGRVGLPPVPRRTVRAALAHASPRTSASESCCGPSRALRARRSRHACRWLLGVQKLPPARSQRFLRSSLILSTKGTSISTMPSVLARCTMLLSAILRNGLGMPVSFSQASRVKRTSSSMRLAS